MGKSKTQKEQALQRKLIPVNIIVCIICLVAALTLFLTPILTIDVGKVLRDDRVMEFVDEKIDGSIKGDLEDTDQSDIDYKPVVTMLVKNILGKAEGKISISAVSAFRVLTSSEKKSDKVLDELLFGEKALATNLINSVVDGVANMFSTNEGKTLLEEAIMSTLTTAILDSVEDQELAQTVAKNTQELVGIFKELGSEEAAADNGAAVAEKFIDRIDEMLGEDIQIDEKDKEEFVKQITDLYSNTKEELEKQGKDDSVSIESIICVNISENFDLEALNLEKLFDGLLGNKSSESAVHIKAVDLELGEEQEGSGEAEDDGQESGDSVNTGSGNGVPATNYDELLEKMGFDKETKENLKAKMRTTLNNELNDYVNDGPIADYLEYYVYVFYAMLVFIGLWMILFLFAFFHLFAKNKRFTSWYVKLFCWIPPLIWLLLALFPKVATKVSFISSFWNGENSALVKAVFGGIGSMTWISGLCYLLLWIVTLFWAFPIKRKIKKVRKEVDIGSYGEDDYDYDDDDDDYDDDYEY